MEKCVRSGTLREIIAMIAARVFQTSTTKKLQKKRVRTKKATKKWSSKYKKSINCSNPKGFSQRAHCAGKKKRTKK